MPERLAVIFGSGFGDLFAGDSSEPSATPYGRPSAPVSEVRLGDAVVAALPRHGSGQDIPAHAINYRANISALQALGVTRVVGLNTVGAISNICALGDVGLPDQLLDYTWGREHTFFDGGAAGIRHIEFTAPFSAPLCASLRRAAAAAGVDCSPGGVYATTQGPRLETAAEIDRLERDGADFVGMTAMPEAALAAELGMQYACLALVVNAAAGRGSSPIHDAVAEHGSTARQRALSIVERLIVGDAES
jgi:5'-methylthioinosine phosphorylase